MKFVEIKKYFIKNKYFLIFVFILVLFFAIKISQMGFKFSDENIYFYMGNLISNGIMPYSNFFFASPPLQIFIISFLSFLFGSKLILLKLIPIFAVMITGSLIFLIVKKEFDSLSAIISFILYLFSFVILTTTDHSTGIHLTTMFLILSFYLFQRKKYILSGSVGAFSLLTRLYAFPVIFGFVLVAFLKNKKSFWKYFLGGLIIFVPINLILFFLFRENYLNSIFFYHLSKTAGISKLAIFEFFIKWDFLLIILSLISIFMKNRAKLIPFLIPAGTTLLFFLFYSDIYYLYFGLLLPFLAILSGITLKELAENVSKNYKKYFYIILILVLVFVIFHNSFFYFKDHASTAKIDSLEEIANYVKTNSNESDVIYGSFEIVPLVAILSERKIINNYIDTNEKVFLTEVVDVGERTKELRGKVKFVIMKTFVDTNGKIVYLEKIVDSDFLLNECKIVKKYPIKKDYQDNMIVIFDCEK